MNKLFLILIPIDANRDELIKYLSTSGYSTFWFYSFPSSFFVRSNYSAAQLQTFIRTKFPTVDKIFITQITKAVDLSGQVPDAHVQYFNNI